MLGGILAKLPSQESLYPDMVPGRVLDIDGDMLAYQAGGRDDTSVAQSRGILTGMLSSFKKHAGAETVVIHLTADGSTKGDRALAATTLPYQGKRKGAKPKNWRYLRDYMLEGNAGEVKNWSQREADDGIVMCSWQRNNRVICTNDKDLRMGPGLHLDWITKQLVVVPRDAYEVVANDKVYGFKWFLLQMLQGDGVDNIPGLGFKTGPKTAEKFLRGVNSYTAGLDAVIAKYREFHPDTWAARFAEQAILLWMRRDIAGSLLNFLDFLPSREDHPWVHQVWDEAIKIETRVNFMKEEAAKWSD